MLRPPPVDDPNYAGPSLVEGHPAIYHPAPDGAPEWRTEHYPYRPLSNEFYPNDVMVELLALEDPNDDVPPVSP